MYYTLLYIYFAIINVLTFAIMGIDKRKAVKHTVRIPERTLFALAAAGGAIGGTLGMEVFRHKTKHLKFKLGFPLIFLLQAAVIIIILLYKNNMLI